MQSTPRVLATQFLAVLVAIGVFGCATVPPRVQPERWANRAVGISDALEFRVEGEPVDTDAPAGETLTLAEALDRALRHSPEIQAALARTRVAQAEARQARLLPNPILTVVLRLPVEGGRPEIEAGLAAELVALLQRPGRSRAADARLRASAAEAVSQTLDVLAELQERYVAVQSLEQVLVTLDERRGTVDRLLELVTARLEAGEATRLDLLTLETQRVDLDAEITERQAELIDARLALARRIGEPGGSAAWKVAPREPNRPPLAPEARWVQTALDRRPDVRASRYELDALAAELGLTRWVGALEGAEAGVEAERADGEWAVGPAASVPLPLFDFGQARRRAAQASLVEARHNLTQIRREVVEETRRAHAALVATHTNLDRLQNQLVPLLERRHEQAEAQFKAGQIDVTGLLLAEQDLRSARTRLVELERRSAEALIRLQRAVGGPVAAAATGEPAPGSADGPPASQPSRATTQPSAARVYTYKRRQL